MREANHRRLANSQYEALVREVSLKARSVNAALPQIGRRSKHVQEAQTDKNTRAPAPVSKPMVKLIRRLLSQQTIPSDTMV